MISKVSLERANPREMVQLKRALNSIPHLKLILSASKNTSLQTISEQLIPSQTLADKIEKEVWEEAGPMISKGNFIRNEVNTELDDLRAVKNSGKEYIAGIQQKEIVRTGINSLKVGFNSVFGYF